MPRSTRSAASLRGVQLSIVVPLFNESATIAELHRRLDAVLLLLGTHAEIVYVDDGSSDGTREALEALAARDERVVLVALARNYGQTAALAAGFDAAEGAVIVAMDGDLQHAPEEIPKLLAKLEEGYDVVSGWREQRVDNLWTRRVPSKIANWMMARISGVSLHDFGTTFKAYRREVLSEIHLYGELHRFIPALASWAGASVAEVPISNIARKNGESNYGISRTVRVLLDLMSVKFLLDYSTKPLQFFGLLGLACLSGGAGIGLWVFLRKALLDEGLLANHGPLMLLGMARCWRGRITNRRISRYTACANFGAGAKRWPGEMSRHERREPGAGNPAGITRQDAIFRGEFRAVLRRRGEPTPSF
jgi:glycosyltransferase involved in cell wall biosynthesis